MNCTYLSFYLNFVTLPTIKLLPPNILIIDLLTSSLSLSLCSSDFGPITISNQSYIQLYLGYDFFYSKAMSHTSDHTMTDSQTILLSFMHNMRTLAGVLLYSETSNGIVQRLEVRA